MSLFAPPTFADGRQTLAARKLWAVLIGLLLTATVLFCLLSVAVPAHTVRFAAYAAAFDGVFIGLLWLARAGRTRLAAMLLVILSAAIVSHSAWTAGGVRAPGMIAYPLLVGIAGLLEGPLAAAATGAACAAISFFLLVAERMGLLPSPTVRHTAASTWLVLVSLLVEFVVIQVIVGWTVRRAEEQALASAAEQERTEAARRESQEKYTKVFRASPDAIVITDLQTGEIIEANPSYEKLFAYSRAELIGRTTLELGIFEDPVDRRLLIEAVEASETIRDREMYARSRSGERIALLFSGELIEVDGRTRMVSIIHDITERKQSEERERKARDEFTRRLISSQEAERRRIASELHDSLGQNLILIKNRAHLALEMAGASPALLAQVKSLHEMAGQAIAEVRQISHDLRPYQLDQLGLTRALEAMIDGTAQTCRFPIERTLDPVDDLFSPEEATHLYRVVQESLSNILKHAQARKARVGLERDIRDVRLWIEDDGCGFAPALSKSGRPIGGLGLSSIAERVRILGGRLRIDSVPGRGTGIEVVIAHSGLAIPRQASQGVPRNGSRDQSPDRR